MRHEPLSGGEAPSEAEQISTLTTSLSRIAEALRVPASSFREPGFARGTAACIADPEAATLLALVEAHLRRLGPEPRGHFIETLQTLIAAERR